MQRSALCRSRRELSNAYFLAKFGFDTAENEPCQVCPTPRNAAAKRAKRVAGPRWRPAGYGGRGGRGPPAGPLSAAHKAEDPVEVEAINNFQHTADWPCRVAELALAFTYYQFLNEKPCLLQATYHSFTRHLTCLPAREMRFV